MLDESSDLRQIRSPGPAMNRGHTLRGDAQLIAYGHADSPIAHIQRQQASNRGPRG
jgi:hypothetical protein